jgi:hypothetical protein
MSPDNKDALAEKRLLLTAIGDAPREGDSFYLIDRGVLVNVESVREGVVKVYEKSGFSDGHRTFENADAFQKGYSGSSVRLNSVKRKD